MKIPTVKAVLINKNSLVLKISVPGTSKYKFKNLEQKIIPAQWDKKAGLCKKAHLNAESINRTIFTERNALVAGFEADAAKGVVFTAEHINSLSNGIEPSNPQDFFSFSRKQIHERNYKEATRDNYTYDLEKIQAYSPTLLFSQINYQWLQSFEKWLRTGRGKKNNGDNAVWKCFKFMNTMIIQAIDSGIIKDNPFKAYDRGNYTQGIPFYLEWDQVLTIHQALRSKPISDNIKIAGYYFMLSCYTGLRFGDASRFNYDTQVYEDSKGRKIVLNAAKNGEIVSISFNDGIAEVVDYIRPRPLTLDIHTVNVFLKILGEIAELPEKVWKEISTHAGRHSFSMRLAEVGVPQERAQRLLGHRDPKSTSVYYRVKNTQLDESMKKMWE